MAFWQKLFGRGSREDTSPGYRVGQLPADTPGEAVLLKASFIEPMIKDLESRMTAAGGGSQFSREAHVLVLAANLAGVPEARLRKLMDRHGSRGGLVHRIDDLRATMENPPLPPDWACPGYLVTLFRL